VVDLASCLEANHASLERLRSIVDALTDDDLRRPVGDAWTVTATLAHLAYWDEQIERWLAEWEQRGFRTPEELEDWDRSLDSEYWFSRNDHFLSEWLGAPPRETANRAVWALESLDRRIQALNPELVGAILRVLPGDGSLERIPRSVLFATRSPWVLRRRSHYDEHLDQIEQACSKV
jgi:hypothetical protein